MRQRANSLLLLGLAFLAVPTLPASEPASAFQTQVAGRVTGLAGSVTVVRSAGFVQPLKVGDALHWGDLVEARADGIARLRLTEGITVTVRPLARVQVREEQGTTGIFYALDLLRGKLRSAVDRALLRRGKQSDDGPRNAVASVRG